MPDIEQTEDEDTTELAIIEDPPVITTVRNEPVAETGYYRIRKTHEKYDYKGFTEGELVYVYAGQSAYHVFIGEYEFNYPYTDADEMAEFDEYFEFVPDGSTIRQQQVASLMGELSSIDLNMIQTRKSLTGFTPHVENGELSTSTALVPTGTSMDTAKKAVAEVRNSTMKLKKDMELKTKKLSLWVKEQSRALAIKAQEMTAIVQKMEEAIWTINLYLGKDEQIYVLRKGNPAPAEEKISIRQGIGFMDEECAIAARSGGIDIESVEQFDEWLLEDDKHLRQVLPETKGIIALHIKRYKQDYGNPWEDVQKNEANLKWTYFLIRNGDNLYRVYVDMNVGSILFPTKDEFEDLFWVEETDWNDPARPTIRHPVKPGSKQYMQALDRAEARRKHYLRIVLVLQGLMDRTPIFKPMPIDRINICDPRHCEEWLNLIYEENVLTDGRPTFREWQKTINEELDVGFRIIGIFDYASKLRGNEKEYEPCRLYPVRANYPDSKVLYTIEDKEAEKYGDRYVFRYERKGEQIYKRDAWNYQDRYVEPTVRARCWLLKSDRFILNFDSATVEEMEYYINHRLSRHEYRDMVPLLDVAINLKIKESEDEAPFRLMLIGQMMQRFGVSNTAAEDKVDELIRWWKFKNRTHRALLSDDAKAASMILDEFGLRRKQDSVRERANVIKDGIIAVIGAQTPAPVLIAHKSDNKYVAYVPHNAQNVWVTEQTWSHNRQTGDILLKESKEWKLVDKRHERWEILYQDERWATWRILPQMAGVLTDPEIAEIMDAALSRMEVKQEKKRQEKYEDEEYAENSGFIRFLPLCMYHDADFKIELWYSDKEPIIPTENVITNGSKEPEVARIRVAWKRTKDGVVLEKYWNDQNHYCYTPGNPPWERNFHGETINGNIIRKWDDNVAMLDKEFAMVKAHEKLVAKLSSTYDYVVSAVSDLMYERKVADARREFDVDYGDPELWEDHLEGLKIQRRDPAYLDSIFHKLAERSINVVGWTLQQVYDKAKELAFKTPGRYHWSSDEEMEIPTDVPMDYVIPPPPPPEPDEDEDDDE